MAPDDELFDLEEDEQDQFVPAVFASCMEEAEVYCELLNSRDIPTLIGDEEGMVEGVEEGSSRRDGMTHGVPVLVPEVLLDETGVIIAGQESLDDIFHTAEDEHDGDDEEMFGLAELDAFDDELYDDADVSDEDDDEL